MSRSQVARRVDLEPAPGLHEYLAMGAEARQILQPLVLAGPGSAAARTPLTCIVGGGPASNGTALLDSGGGAVEESVREGALDSSAVVR